MRSRVRYALAPLTGAAVLTMAVLGAGPAVGIDDDEATTGPGVTTTTTTTSTSGPASTTAPPGPPTVADVRPRIAPTAAPLHDPAEGVLPDADAVTEAVREPLLENEYLGPTNRRSLTVIDVLTGEDLTSRVPNRLITPASTAKLVSAAAVVTALEPDHRFRTAVVTSAPDQDGSDTATATAGAVAGDTDVVLVAGGDMLLAEGAGDPDAVTGHAGVADLAEQTAEEIRAGGAVPDTVRVSLDLDHVEGPDVLDTWTDQWVAEGWTGRIVQLGFADDLALPYQPSPEDPEQEVAAVFAEALAQELDTEVVLSGGERAEVVSAPQDAVELAAVESAPLRDVLGHALQISDNAMTEQLARQAADAAGAGTDQESVTDWILTTVQEEYGVDLTGAVLPDASGLSGGGRLSTGMIARILLAGADGSHQPFQEVLAAGGLPIAGLTGTLGQGTRFQLPEHEEAVGVARAKTGTLPGVTGLAGLVTTRDGRLLVFAAGADDLGTDWDSVVGSYAALDEIVARLANCGC